MRKDIWEYMKKSKCDANVDKGNNNLRNNADDVSNDKSINHHGNYQDKNINDTEDNKDTDHEEMIISIILI